MIKDSSKIISVDRLERKWAIGGDLDINTFFIAIYRSSFVFTESYKPRSVNTIYFDDADYSSIFENLDGDSLKKKYRLRWYGNSEIISKPQFEIKSKIGLVNKKKTFPIELSKDINFDHDGIEKILDILIKKFNFNKILLPILSTHYLRYYFVSSNKKVRATFDKSLKSHQLRGYQNLSFKKDFKNSVFEIKYDKKYDNYVARNLKNISLRISKNSKYVISSLDQPISFS